MSDSHEEEVPLAGGRFAGPVRSGGTVLRPASAASTNVAALLSHLESAGFDQAPRNLGVSSDGRDQFSFIEGDSALPPYREDVRSDAALVDVAKTIRRFHDATHGFVPPEPWTPVVLEVAKPVDIDCVGHGDLTPWNMIFQGPRVAGIIDWDTAGPSNRAWDLAYAAYHLVPLHPPDTLAFWGWSSVPDQPGRLQRFVDAYGDPTITPARLLDLMIIRLASFAAHAEQEIRTGNPAFDVHRDEDHAGSSRRSAAFLIEHRATFFTPGKEQTHDLDL